MALPGFCDQRDQFFADVGILAGCHIGLDISIEVWPGLPAGIVDNQRNYQFDKVATLANRLDATPQELHLVAAVRHQNLAHATESVFAPGVLLNLALALDCFIQLARQIC